MILACAAGCGPFRRQGTRGPIPRYCSVACKARHRRSDQRREYERGYKQRRRAQGLDVVDNVARRGYFRERWRRLHGDPDVELPAPYSGHRWLDMARAAVGASFDPSAPWADDYYDEMGEAVLALLEGRDMKQAVADHRRRGYVPRHLTLYLGDWKDSDEERHESSIMPTVPSAEDEVVAQEAVVLELKARYHHGRNDRPTNKSRRSHSQPSRRRMRDAGLREHRRGGLQVA